jgi:hypothetical protein
VSAPPGWVVILETMETALAQVAAEALARESPTGAEPAGDSSADRPPWGFGHLDGCLGGFLEALQRAEHLAGEADRALQATEEAIRGWLAAAGSLRQRLAAGAPWLV